MTQVNKKFYHRENCRLCLSTNLEKVLELPPTPAANQFKQTPTQEESYFPLDVYLCLNCKHAQLLDVVDPTLLFDNYLYVSGTSPVFREHFKNYAHEVFQTCKLDKDSLIVDIGSNDGTLLKEFKELGTNICGIDPAKKISQIATENGIPTLCGYFNSETVKTVKEKYGQASVITANNVFAHIDQLRDVVLNVKNLLRPNGVFVFEVSYLLDVMEKTLFDTIYHEHLDYHAVKPLVPFFENFGLKLFHVSRVSSHGGSIRCYVCSQETNVMNPSVEELIQLEEKAGLFSPITYKNLHLKIINLGEQLQTLLIELKKSAKKIAGYGAPAKLTTLLHTFKLEKNLIDYIVDDGPMKQGLYCPGYGIEIKSSKALQEDAPDYIVIFAWNFAESIMKNNPGFNYIVPLPELKIYKKD